MKRLLLILSICFFSSSIFSQDKVRVALDSIASYYPRETIYLFLHKSDYVAGETAWFSAFVFSGYDLSSISTNLFVELYDSDKKLLKRQLIPLFRGQAAGEISLSPRLAEGVYFIHVYTQWMTNFSRQGNLIPLLIYNPKSPKALKPKILPYSADAFVEGGQLVDGLVARVAIRLSSPSALPQRWSGYLTEKGNGNKIAEFKNLDPNIAIVQFIPQAGHQYQLNVDDERGQNKIIELPKVSEDGIQLRIDNRFDSILYTIQFRNVNSAGYRLIGVMNNEVLYEAVIKKQGSMLKKSIQTSGLDNGILRLTLFDANDHPVAERLCFVKPTSLEIKSPSTITKSIELLPRGRNKLEFLTDTVDNPYSVAVLDAAVSDPMERENILSALWFSQDVLSPVQDAGKYFIDPDDKKAEALDAILITEKLRDFDWNEILNGKFPLLKFYPDNFISFKGTVLRNKKLVPNENVNLIFSFPDSSTQIMQVTTDSSGSFVLQNMFFYDTVRVFYQLNSKKSSARNISIQFEKLNTPAAFIPEFPVQPYELTDRVPGQVLPETVSRSLMALNSQLDVDNKYKTLKEVTVTTRKKSVKDQLNEELSSPLFQTFNETVFDFVNEDQSAQGYMNILLWLEGRVAGFRVEFRNNNYVPILRNSQVAIYVDEMQVDPQFINGYPISDIAMVKVIKGYFVGGFGGGGGIGDQGIGGNFGSGGAIAIYTRKGEMHTANRTPLLNNSKLPGYEKWKDYPAPNYKENFYRDLKTDLRELLYWKPFAVASNEQQKLPVEFFNNDSAKEFRILIAGMTPDGMPVFLDKVLK